MYEIAKHEFLKWIGSLSEHDRLSPAESNLLNLILNNFDSIASKGTASGARANYIVLKLEERKFSLAECNLDLHQNAMVVSPSMPRLHRLEVQSFRGFSTHLLFDFSKQYTTFFGSNGSGKSSLCDALEYGILGTVQEASTRRIGLEEFLKNKKNELFVPPKLFALVDGEEVIFESDYEKFQFSFIEKNRIDKFSHINASTPGDKAERLAALFGLTEFLEFVKGFTDSLDGKILISSIQLQIKEEREKKREEYANRINEITGRIEDCDRRYRELIVSLGTSCPKNLDEAIKYLQSDDGSGRIKELEDTAQKERKPEYSTAQFIIIVKHILSLKERFHELCSIESKLLSFCVNSYLVDIYTAVINLSNDVDHSLCPACQTPITKTVKNPYIYAKEELEKLNEFTTLKKQMHEAQKTLLSESRIVNDELSKNSEMLESIGVISSAFLLPTPNSIDQYLEEKNSIQEGISRLLTIVSNKDGYESILIKQNAVAKEMNERNEYTKEANRLREILRVLIEIRGERNSLIEEKDNKAKDLKILIEESENIETKVKEEAELNDRKMEYIEAYKRLLNSLREYQVQLPIAMASSLSDKVMSYYNIMNKGDASFELIDNLMMPVSANDNIMIKFNDGIEVNALQVLSEGHVKLLGLAILLAKAKETNQRFLILDDIVNAIDDDHRSGVASLLFQNEDFRDIQIILTSHSESFIKRIEDSIPISGRAERITRYVFITPIEDESDRGIVVNYTDPKEPLELARIDLRDNNFKDAAQKCRQATESLMYKLWKKLSSQLNVPIAVALRSPDSRPDLYSIVDGIIKFLSKYESVTNGVLSIIKEIKSTYNWFLLNKGSHYEDDQFQFEASDVRNICLLLENLDSAIKALKINSLVVVDE